MFLSSLRCALQEDDLVARAAGMLPSKAVTRFRGGENGGGAWSRWEVPGDVSCERTRVSVFPSQ